MKNKNKLSKLSIRGQYLELPKYNYEFEHFKSELQKAIDENFGYTVAKTLEYDEDRQ